MKKLLFLLFAVFLIVLADIAVVLSEVCAQEHKGILPEKFLNEKEAIQHKCKVIRLKDTKQKSCMIQEFEGHDLKLIFYDANNKGEFQKFQQLCIPSWYWKAKVKHLDFLGEGKEFIFVEFEGNTGTGTLQTILMIIGWKENKFVPVLAETISYDIMEREDGLSLKMKYAFENLKTSKVALWLNYKFMAYEQ